MKKLVCLVVISCGVHSLHADQTLRSLQETLKQQGCYYGKLTGENSAETTSAIRRYQIRNGLKVTGALNEETTRSLSAIANSVAAASRMTSKPRAADIDNAHPGVDATFSQKLPLASVHEPARQVETNPHSSGSGQPAPVRVNRRSIAEAQYQLMSHGYYRGRVDGKYGQDTAFALRAFQSSSGLPATGRLDTATLQALRSSDADFAYLAPPSRVYEFWMPVRKFKNSKWKVKWKKHFGGAQPGEHTQANRQPSWNPYNED
jgi:peptidoglycan hydrolase-like protein with peptidoglycan-binding domain